jgi:hypothetical protein
MEEVNSGTIRTAVIQSAPTFEGDREVDRVLIRAITDVAHSRSDHSRDSQMLRFIEQQEQKICFERGQVLELVSKILCNLR